MVVEALIAAESGLSFLWGKAQDHRIPKWQNWRRLWRTNQSSFIRNNDSLHQLRILWYSLCSERNSPHFVNYPDQCHKLLRNRKFHIAGWYGPNPAFLESLGTWLPATHHNCCCGFQWTCLWRSHWPNHFQHECTKFSELQRSLEYQETWDRSLSIHMEGFE